MEKEITTLNLMDTFPFGDLRGCKVYEAIDHSPARVYDWHCKKKIRLSQKAISRLINRIYQLRNKNKA